MNKAAKNILALSLISAIVAVLMAITNYITAPIIEKNQNQTQNAALLIVMPDATSFEELDLSSYELPKTVKTAYQADNGGYVLKLSTTGFAADLIILCGVDANGAITGTTCLESKETLGYEKTYGDNFKGLSLDGIDSVDTVANATKTTAAYRAALKDAVNAVTVLKGGSVDLRDEETILRDNMTALFPASEGKFTRMFISEVLDGVKAVYTADNGAGHVFLIGDKMFALTGEGEVLGDADENEKTLVTGFGALLAASKVTELDITALDLPKTVKKVEITESGNYIFTVNANGYASDKPYMGNTPIVIRLSMTKDGKILDCDTVSHKESAGYGADCEKDAFTDQFIGKTGENYREIDGISGATTTTNGYLTGIKRAYEALSILNGGDGQ